MLAYDREGPRGATPVVLLHAGIADRRMWDRLWPALTAERDAIRLDLRGFGESVERPSGALDPVADVLETVDVERFELVGVSFSAGVAVEVALEAPDRVASLVLAAPGGSLIAEATPQLRAFWEAENAALEADDLDAAVAANVSTWVPGADPAVRELVAIMQRRAFELTADWDDVEEVEREPLERLGEIRVPTTVVLGGRDIDAIHESARRVVDGVRGAQLLEWPDVAHLPPLERPDDFVVLVLRRDQR